MMLLADKTCLRRQQNEAGPPPRRGSWLGLILLLLAGLLVFAHGCHGDEDNELFGQYLAVTR